MAKSLMKSHKTQQPRSTTSAADPIAELLVSRAGMIQRMEYEPLGRLLMIQTAAGWIEFRRNMGPTIAQISEGIEMVDPWPGLKDRVAVTEELCPDCLAPCDECGATGQRLCTQCGGADAIKAGEEPCICVKTTGHFNPACENCRGVGSINVMKVCPRCEVNGAGTGLMQCPECRGTTKMSTGHKGGVLPTRNGAVCESCEGYGKKLKRAPQDLAAHTIRQNGAIFLGPILGFLIKPVGEEREPQPWKASADGLGRQLFLVSRMDFRPGTRVAFVGGIAVPQTLTSK